MVKWYLLQIQMNRMTLEEVPKRWHDAVAEALNK
jgi:hypothetical protein